MITSHSLGAVTIGMTIAQASGAAGEPLTEVGDGQAYPGGNQQSSLHVAGIPTIGCLVAALSGAGPTVVTQRGFPLGGTLARLKAVYGSALAFVPKPAMAGPNFPVPGYIVAFPDGNLAFIVTKGLVTVIAAGPGVKPSTCGF